MEHVTTTPNGSGHETREISVSFIVGVAAGPAIRRVPGLSAGRWESSSSSTTPMSPRNAQASPSRYSAGAAHRSASLPKQLQSMRAQEDHVLNTYAVTDPKQGIVRVPIDRAIDMLAEKGLPHARLSGRHPGGPQAARAAAAHPAVEEIARKYQCRSNRNLHRRTRILAPASAATSPAQQYGLPAMVQRRRNRSEPERASSRWN